MNDSILKRGRSVIDAALHTGLGRFLVVATAIGLGSQASMAQMPATVPADTPSVAQTPAACQATGTDNSSAKGTVFLHAGDVIRVKTLDDPSLTREYSVPADGSVQFWKGARYQVTTMTPQCLQARVIQDYAKDLAHPSDIEVTIGYRVAVSGAVKSPGVYTADVTMSIADVLALSGGVSGEGNSNKILVLREGVEQPIPLAVSTSAMTTKIQSGDRIYVEQKSWLARNIAPTITAASAALYLLVSVVR